MARGKTSTKECEKCNRQISLFAFNRHYKSCCGNKKPIRLLTKSSSSTVVCVFCNRLFSTASGRGLHEIQCKQNENSVNIQQGRKAWNKGNRSKPDNRNPAYVGKLGGYRENAGRSKKFKVIDSFGKETTLQSTYELRCSEILNDLGFKWFRPKALKYDGRNYFADFYLPDHDIWLDPKNDYKAKQDVEKIKRVIQQNNVKLYVILDHQLSEEYIRRLAEMD